MAISLNGTIRQACYQSPGKVFAIYRPQEALGGSLVAQALEGADLGAAHTQQATPGGVKVPAQAKGTTSRLRRRHRLKAKAAAEAAEEATWASLLGEEMQLGPMKESDEEYDVWAHYLRVMDDNFDYNLEII